MAGSMRGVSAESQEALVSRLQTAIASGADGDRLADALFGVAELLAGEPRLRRVLTDLSVDAEAKAGLVRQVLADKVDPSAVDVVAEGARLRWSGPRDLGYAVEHAGIVAVVEAADRAGHGDRLEHELFTIGQLVQDSPELRDALSDPARSVADKRELLRALLAGRVTSGTLRLVELSTSGSHRTVSVALDAYQRVAAAHRQRLVAVVHVARALSDEEVQRLAGVLSRQYDRPVHLNTVVDPGVIGGIRVEIGDEVIDGTISTRLDDARRRLAG